MEMRSAKTLDTVDIVMRLLYRQGLGRYFRMVLGLGILLSEACLSQSPIYAPKHEAASVQFHTAASVLSLTPDEAKHGYPAMLRGIVTRSGEIGLTIQDSTAGIWINLDHSDRFVSGDLLEIRGTVAPGGYSPEINAISARKIGHAAMPQPKQVTVRQLESGDEDSQYVSIVGTVRSIQTPSSRSNRQGVWLKLATVDGMVDATLSANDAAAANQLLDAQVRINAVAMCAKNKNRQITAVVLAVGDIRNLTVLQPAPKDLFDTPLITIGKLMQYRSGTNYDHRVRVAGTVTYYEPGKRLILEDGKQALLVMTPQVSGIRLGDRIEALGFPTPEGSGPILQDAILRFVSHGEPLSPTADNAAEIAAGTSRYNLVSVEGRILRRVDEPSGVALLVQSNSQLLQAEMPQQTDSNELRNLHEGTTVRISGISLVEVEGRWNYAPSVVRCKLLLRSPNDIQILEPPSWWTMLHVIYIAMVLALAALVFLALVVYNQIERSKLQAVLEERGRLAHEIHDTMAQSFAGIGFQLQAIYKAIPNGIPHLRQQVELARDLVRHSHKEARRSVEPLQFDSNEEIDLLTSVESCAKNMVEGGSVTIKTRTVGTQRSVPAHVANVLLRIGQEAVANAIRHADPTCLELLAEYETDAIRLEVRDDGNGFVKSGDLLGFGLRGMRKRAAGISAKLEIYSVPGEGTRVEVTAPLKPNLTLASGFSRIWKFLWEHGFYVKTKQLNPNSDRG
jgi:signal transduction histidine kinase